MAVKIDLSPDLEEFLNTGGNITETEWVKALGGDIIKVTKHKCIKCNGPTKDVTTTGEHLKGYRKYKCIICGKVERV